MSENWRLTLTSRGTAGSAECNDRRRWTPRRRRRRDRACEGCGKRPEGDLAARPGTGPDTLSERVKPKVIQSLMTIAESALPQRGCSGVDHEASATQSRPRTADLEASSNAQSTLNSDLEGSTTRVDHENPPTKRRPEGADQVKSTTRSRPQRTFRTETGRSRCTNRGAPISPRRPRGRGHRRARGSPGPPTSSSGGRPPVAPWQSTSTDA